MANIRYVGILNVTPDSFSDGGKFMSVNPALAQATTLFADGAELVDIGAESTNPWSKPLTAKQEIARLTELAPAMIAQFGSDRFSLDTYHPETLAWALEQGMRPLLNDVSGLHNSIMRDLVVMYGLRVIISHLPTDAHGIPTRAHTNKAIEDIQEVVTDLLQTSQQLQEQGLPKHHIILDPGIGFGKTMRLNWQLLDLPSFVPAYDVMLGYSRKRFLHTTRAGAEIPKAIALKREGGEAYQAWLAEQHFQIRTHITSRNRASAQTIYLRVHAVAD